MRVFVCARVCVCARLVPAPSVTVDFSLKGGGVLWTISIFD